MSVKRKDPERVFQPCELASIGQACEQVCDELGYHDARFAKEAVATYIMALAALGHTDAAWLRASALAALGRRADHEPQPIKLTQPSGNYPTFLELLGKSRI